MTNVDVKVNILDYLDKLSSLRSAYLQAGHRLNKPGTTAQEVLDVQHEQMQIAEYIIKAVVYPHLALDCADSLFRKLIDERRT